MPEIRVFEPALCCNTGVCGPDLDQALVDFTADLSHLIGLGADVQRHNLANDPSAFASSNTVRAFLQVAGSDGLPLTLLDGLTVLTGAYPTREQLMRYAGLGSDSTQSTVPLGSTELGRAELGLTEPGSIEPGSIEPGSIEPGSIEPGSTEPGLTELGSTEKSGGCCGPTGCC